MKFIFVPMNEEYAEQMLECWKYEGEYSIYNYINEKDWIMEREAWGRDLFAVINESDELIGELSMQFFDPKEVAIDELQDLQVLWIGFGLKPELNGKGLGVEFVTRCVEFGVSHYNYKGKYVGLGVAEFNQRAVKAYIKAGFDVYHREMDELYGKEIEAVWMKKQI
ncbi:MAG: N-acetyltransferase [Clostridiales bacterium]|jgi:ribosomal-protein-alanine N-acetyltransferase|nr:N-acetyltransferase [Clostridiales bacterium]